MKILNEMNNFYYSMSLYELQIMNETDIINKMSYNSMLYMNVIEQIKNCTVSKIADALKVTKSAVTLKVNELEKQGVIIKTQSEIDKRVFFVTLTPAVKEYISIYDDVFSKIELQLCKKYSDNELDIFVKILRDIAGYRWMRVIENE